ncbi:MAG TPA: SDR family oxidoreductase [Thermoanaerobaculia bacterium]
MPALFFTGYPGFLGAELLPRLLARNPLLTARCLVQPKFAALARERASSLGGRVQIVEGDITRPIDARRDDVAEVWHLAAIYDLAVKRDVATRVNVDGTRHVLDFAASCPKLARFQYVSTCYVSGPYDGVFLESDLEKGQSFNNDYEATKYLAEVLVQERMATGMAATIYRPAIVVGDSSTGETQKFDGPYFVIRWLLRQPRVALLPVIGDPRRFRANFVPRDFIVRAIEHLSALDESKGKVYQLADPEPMTVDEIIRAIATATNRRIVRLPLTKGIAKFALERVPGVHRLMRIPSASVDYFVHPTTYDTANTLADLRGSGIEVPRLRDYLPRLVEFMRAHPEIGSAAMA